jgi:hypothetical protein
MKLYSITTIHEGIRQLRKDNSWFETEDLRCISICDTVDIAKEFVENNYGDMYECGYYKIVVIEAFETNYVYGGFDREEYWYQWKGDVETGGYKSIEKPEKWKNIINWGIG